MAMVCSSHSYALEAARVQQYCADYLHLPMCIRAYKYIDISKYIIYIRYKSLIYISKYNI